MDELPSVTITDRVYILFNPRSGNRQGQHLESYDIQDYRLKSRPWVNVSMYNVVDEVEVYIQEIKHFLNKSDCKLHVWSAGGDGTFVSAIRTLHDNGIDVFHQQITWSCIPFGTGNDLSQNIGWGAKVSISTSHRQSLFNREIIRRLDGNILKMDIWRVHLETGEEGWCEVKGTHKRFKNLDTLMSNYMNIGLAGEVGKAFEQRRHKSRFGNVYEYFIASVRHMLRKHVLRLGYFLDKIKTPSNTFTLENDYNKSVELIIQNLYGIWGRRVNLWEECKYLAPVLSPIENEADVRKWSPKVQMDDGRLEMFCIKSRWDYLSKQFKAFRGKLPRLGQFNDVELQFKQNSPDLHYMIDGEFMTSHHPLYMKISRFGQINMLVNNELQSNDR